MNRLVSLFLLAVILLLSSCKRNDTILITGNIKGIKEGKVYLYLTYPINSLPIDSVTVTNGKFEFKLHPDTIFQPQLGRIRYQLYKKEGLIGVVNPYSPNKNKPDIYADFILEPGITTLTGDISKNEYAGVKIFGGKQNEYYFKHINLPFLRISTDSNKHKMQFQSVKKIVHDGPDNYQAMFALQGGLKYMFSKDELKAIYAEFDDDVKQAYYGRMVNQFISQRPESNAALPDNLLEDINGKPDSLIDKSNKINLVIFWASWCGPCRQEIPLLKKVYERYGRSGIGFVSVSLDKEKAEWKKALREENMLWRQLLIPQGVKTKMEAQYNLGFIPQIYIIDNKQNIVKHIVGMEDDNGASIGTFLDNQLTKQQQK